MAGDAHFRRAARHPLALRVRFRRDAPDAALNQRGEIVDLGMGGAHIMCDRPPAVGTALIVSLIAPSAWDPLELPAEVRWSTPPGTRADQAGFGVRFGSLRPSQATALHELLEVTLFEEEEQDD